MASMHNIMIKPDNSANMYVNEGFADNDNDDGKNRNHQNQPDHQKQPDHQHHHHYPYHQNDGHGSSTSIGKVSNTKTTNSNNGGSNHGKSSTDVERGDGAVKYTKAKHDCEGEEPDYNNITKRETGHVHHGSGNVDFSLPSSIGGQGRDRSKSIGSDGPYRGMGKEELLRFSSRPLWRNLRYACMSIVLTGWLALLITVVAMVLTYPHCRAGQRKDWWQKTVVYRIYVRSYMDYDSDGIGDIRGIIHQLGYLKETGVGTISLSPIYKLSLDATEDSHVINHTDIDPVFGTMAQFESLVNKTHALGMRIVLDFIPNHTSDKHPWFVRSRKEADPKKNRYRSYYVWQHGGGSNGFDPPNAWQSVYNCSAWTWTSNKNSHYLHQFAPTQPELNLRSEKVRVEMEDILKFWLDLGVDGFYIRHSDFLFEDYDFRDNVLEDNSTSIDECPSTSSHSQKTWYPYKAYSNHHTKGLTEVFDMLARWRAFLDDYGNKTNSYRILLADADGPYDHVMHYYGLFNRDGVDIPLNKFSLQLRVKDGGQGVASMVDHWLSRMPAGRWANWMGGDDRSERLVDRLGSKMAAPYLVLTMLLPGTPFLYYGDEIEMGRSILVNASSGVPGSRKMPMRGPMLWNNKTHAGFCFQYCKEPWIPLYANYTAYNVESQRRDPYSMWHLVKNLTGLRDTYPSFEYGDYVKSIQDDKIFSFVREFDGEKGFLVALNFADTKVRRHFTGTHETIPSGGKIEIVSGKTSRRRGDSIDLDPLTLEENQAIVVSWDYKAKEI